MDSTSGYNDETDRPTEEIYLELRNLTEAAGTRSPDDPPARPVTSQDDPTGIQARIAHLRALLSDRGTPFDE